MIHINLLPVRQIRKRLQVRNEVAIYMFSVLILMIFISLVALNKISTIDNLKVQNQALSKKKASYQPILNEIAKLKKDKQEQETKLEVIKKLKTGSQVTVHVMDELAKLTPSNRLWLSNLRQFGMGLSVTGVALDNATIAQYMNNIATSDYFSGAELASSSQTVIAGAKLKSFSLSIGVVSPKNNNEETGEKK
jgi:type IV pilus assembly protein PilN